MVARIGSSPLARGLRRPVIRALGKRGIIPARAGFTTPALPPAPTGSDHPRSRGVYNDLLDPEQQYSGSSPLARGLRDRGRTARRATRIIPARAGFTQLGRRRAAPGPDHPRSRGVYGTPPGSTRGFRGSSPLARGLLVGRRGQGNHDRIIPARAGFTRVGHARPISPTDHPRSRGVYADFGMLSEDEAGSSPLARGLPTAGTRRPEWQADHPRSRGVYSSIEVPAAAATGSSPLARGLHPRWRSGRGSAGIIPARAGFT